MIKFYQNGQQVEKIDFGTTDVGSSNTITVEIKNTYGKRVKLLFPKSLDSDVKVISLPEALNPDESQSMTLMFDPNIMRRDTLQSDIKFRVVM